MTVMDIRGLSARAYNRILKVARAAADPEASDKINASHIFEAINHRNPDRDGWHDRFISEYVLYSEPVYRDISVSL